MVGLYAADADADADAYAAALLAEAKDTIIDQNPVEPGTSTNDDRLQLQAWTDSSDGGDGDGDGDGDRFINVGGFSTDTTTTTTYAAAAAAEPGNLGQPAGLNQVEESLGVTWSKRNTPRQRRQWRARPRLA